ncbi:MAG: hypothetical protein NXI31_04915 [bacterium]|nr:hypothetical protein [bacterium]
MKKLTTFAFLLTAAASLSQALSAQDLTADVVRDPSSGTVTYTIDLDGPPRGLAFPFVSLLQGPPVFFPGVIGPLLVDPILIVPMGVVPLVNQQQQIGQIQAPIGAANGLPLFFQALVVDQQNQVALSDFGVAVPRWLPANAQRPAVGLTATVNNGVIDVVFGTGPGNANVTIQVNGGRKAAGNLVLDSTGMGTGAVQVPGGMQPGDHVQVFVNGEVVLDYGH